MEWLELLPEWLKKSIKEYEKNQNTLSGDCYYCELQSDINVAEVDGLISSEIAWVLREKYLGIQRGA